MTWLLVDSDIYVQVRAFFEFADKSDRIESSIRHFLRIQGELAHAPMKELVNHDHGSPCQPMTSSRPLAAFSNSIICFCTIRHFNVCESKMIVSIFEMRL
jgi:hypothetical protein